MHIAASGPSARLEPGGHQPSLHMAFCQGLQTGLQQTVDTTVRRFLALLSLSPARNLFERMDTEHATYAAWIASELVKSGLEAIREHARPLAVGAAVGSVSTYIVLKSLPSRRRNVVASQKPSTTTVDNRNNPLFCQHDAECGYAEQAPVSFAQWKEQGGMPSSSHVVPSKDCSAPRGSQREEPTTTSESSVLTPPTPEPCQRGRALSGASIKQLAHEWAAMVTTTSTPTAEPHPADCTLSPGHKSRDACVIAGIAYPQTSIPASPPQAPRATNTPATNTSSSRARAPVAKESSFSSTVSAASTVRSRTSTVSRQGASYAASNGKPSMAAAARSRSMPMARPAAGAAVGGSAGAKVLSPTLSGPARPPWGSSGASKAQQQQPQPQQQQATGLAAASPFAAAAASATAVRSGTSTPKRPQQQQPSPSGSRTPSLTAPLPSPCCATAADALPPGCPSPRTLSLALGRSFSRQNNPLYVEDKSKC